MALIRLNDVVKQYPAIQRGGESVLAVDHVSFDIEQGEILAIIGYSGAGKSTLVRLVNGLESATSGSLQIDGTEIVGLRERELRPIRRDIGMIFQSFNLFNSKTVYENVAFPLRVANFPKGDFDARIAQTLDFVGLLDRAYSYPDQLSGGQKQRVGIARALATNPRILLADEATSALDPETTAEVLEVLRRVNKELGTTVVLITHELSVVRALAERVIVLERGRVVEDGDVYDVFSNPRSEAARRFVATVIHSVPSGDALEALRLRHQGRFITVSIDESAGQHHIFFAALAQHGIAFELIYGGINAVRGRSFGYLTLSLAAEDQVIDRFIAEASRSFDVVEVH